MLQPPTASELRAEAGRNPARIEFVKKYLADNNVEGGLASLNAQQVEDLFRELVRLV